MNIKTEPMDVEINVPDRSSCSSSSSVERGNSPLSPNPKDNSTSSINDTDNQSSTAVRGLTAARNSPLTDLLDDCSKPIHHHPDHVVDTPSTQITIKLEAASSSNSVSGSPSSPPSAIGNGNVSNSQRSIEVADVVSQVCSDAVVVSAARSSPVPVPSTTARITLSTAESSISKLESFVASLNQHNRREFRGINLVPDNSVASAALWTGSVGFHQIAKATGGDSDHRMPLPTSPMAATLAAGVVEDRSGAVVSATCYRPRASMFATKSQRNEFSNGVEGVSGSLGRREEPLDLSVKKTEMNQGRRTFNDQSSTSNSLRRAYYCQAPETISNGFAGDRLERRQHIDVRRHERAGPTTVASAANSLACLERDFGENSALLNRIGSLNQLRHVHHGLAEFVTQQNARLCQQSHADKRQQYAMGQSYQQLHQQSHVDSIGLRVHQPLRESGLENDLGCLERSTGVIVTPPSPPVGVATNGGTRSSIIGQLLSINVPNASDQQQSRSDYRPPLYGGPDIKSANSRDNRNRRKSHHHQCNPLQQPHRETHPPASANLTATVAALKCLECNGRFSSLPELTLHMIQAGHYANIVCADGGSRGNRVYGKDVIRSAYTGWDVGKDDVVNNLSTTRWQQGAGPKNVGPASPPSSLDDDESISSASIPDSGSASMSPIKSPALSASSLSPARQDGRKDGGDKLLVNDLLKRVDPLVARNLMLSQPNNLFNVPMDSGSPATEAVAAFGMVIKSMKKYIECSLNQSVIDVDRKSNVTANTQRRSLRHHQRRQGDAMSFDSQSKTSERENPHLMQIHRKISSSSSISDSFDASEAGARKSCDVTSVSRKRGSANHIVNIPDKRFAVRGVDDSPLERRRLFDVVRRDNCNDSRNRISNTGMASTESVSSKPSPPPPLCVATAPSEAHVTPSRSSLQELDVICSSSEHRPNMTSQTSTASDACVVANGNSVMVPTKQFPNIEDISVSSSPSLPHQSVASMSTIDCSGSGSSDVNEYTMRFGKYCRLARELAGRAN